MSLNWHGDAAMEEIRRLAHRAVANVVRELFDVIIVSISIQGPPRSDPGEPPHIDTRNLLENFLLEYSEDALAYRISSPDVYSIYLEVGTILMAARPYMWPAIFDVHARVESLLKSGLTTTPVASGYNSKFVTY